MTDLHWALLALGAVFIVSVMAFNWWQERKFKRETSSRFDEPRYDALMEKSAPAGDATGREAFIPESYPQESSSRERLDRDDDFQFDHNAILKEDDDDHHAEVRLSEPAVKLSQAATAASVQAEAYAQTQSIQTQPTDTQPIETQYPDTQAYAEPEFDNAADETQRVADFEPEHQAEYQADFAAEYEPETALHEPAFAEPADPADTVPPWEEETQLEPQPVHVTAPSSQNPNQSPADLQLPAEINTDIDFCAVLALAQPASGLQLREFLLSITDIDKPVYAYGLAGDQRWHLLTREQESTSFSAAVCTLQLADRAGAVSTGSLSRFHLAVEALADNLNADLEWVHVENPLQHAAQLDQFCIEVDQMVAFHLTHGGSGSFTGTKFRGLAEAGGLSLGTDGAYHYLAEGADGEKQVLFSVVNHDPQPFTAEMLRSSVIRGVSFQLDIPRVRSYGEAYNHMVLLARQMEHSLGAHLVDEKQRELGEAQIDKIRQQIKLIHDKMVARGIAPGEAYALRLFS